MKIRYDAAVDALSIIFIETTVTTQQVAEAIVVEYDADGHVAGIEILDACARFGDADPLRSVTLEGVALSAPVP
jgi:uncharacterized protein YuzE